MEPSSLIFLVHGTIPRIGKIRFFKEQKWVTDGSPFRRSICTAMPNCHCESFSWSGDNSHVEREAAGRNLAAQITERAAQFPGIPILVSAHSHGGNVTLYAMQFLSPEVRARIAGLVTLGTPFIWFREHWSEGDKYAVLRGLRNAVIGWAIGALTLFPLMLTRFRWIEFMTLLITAALGGIYAWLKSVAHVNWNAAARQLIARFQPVMESNTKLLAAATNVDEAGWWLRALLLPSRFFDALSFMGFRSFARNAPTPDELPRTKLKGGVQGGDIVSTVIMSLVMQVAWLFMEPAMRVLSWLLGCWFNGIVGLAQFGLGLIGRSLGRSAPWGFGETWTFPWLVDVWTEVLPVGATASQLLHSRSITTLNLNHQEAGQTELEKFVPKRLCSPHSWLHNDPRVIAFVTKWARIQCIRTSVRPTGVQ